MLNATSDSVMHVVTHKCHGCKFTDCVEVCPVACFYELDHQVVIHAEDCIDCTACVDVCPVSAIYSETDVPPEFQADIAFNAEQARLVKDAGKGAILKKQEPLPTSAQRKQELGY
jgi:ferredoxin